MDYDHGMTNSRTSAEMYAEAQEHLTLALEHGNMAAILLRQCGVPSSGMVAPSTAVRTIRGGGRSLDVWARWLANHQPATRQTIWDATGVKLSERATPHTVLCDDSIGDLPDGTFLPDTVCRMRARPSEGRGGVQVIYFLWSQRFDVRPLFGVGPERPMAPSDSEVQTLLGVVMPPQDSDMVSDEMLAEWLSEGVSAESDHWPHIVDENGWEQGVLTEPTESQSNEIPDGCLDCGGTNHSAGDLNRCPVAQADAVARTRAAQQATVEED